MFERLFDVAWKGIKELSPVVRNLTILAFLSFVFACALVVFVTPHRVVFICLASAGLYLTYVGWKPQPRTPHATANPTQDRPMPRVIKHRDIRRAEMLDRALELH